MKRLKPKSIAVGLVFVILTQALPTEAQVTVQFLPIDFDKHSATCIQFREDSFEASFGDTDKFHESDGLGATRYLNWLREKSKLDPLACVHIWHENKIIGQIEMGPLKADPRVLNVNLFYLDSSSRGKGFGDLLQSYIEAYMLKKGFIKAQLTVSHTNARAIAYYVKHGWKMIGPHPKDKDVLLMDFVPTQSCESKL